MLNKTLAVAYGIGITLLAGSIVLAIGFLASGSADLVLAMVKVYVVGGLAAALWIGGAA